MTTAQPQAASGLEAHVVVRRAGHELDVDVRARPGEVLAVVGPNGSGKSTLLRALAGLVPLDDGRVAYDGVTWEDRGRRLAAPGRRVGLVFQDVLLFPHLDALDNVAYGLRATGTPRDRARARAREWLARLGVEAQAAARPHALSGGQAQRVAIARALAPRPRLLLLDEPLSALDVQVALSLRAELTRHLAAYDGVTILVTHDAADALTLADRVLVLEGGRVVQEGPPAEVAARPGSAHVARLVGLNVLAGRASGTTVELAGGDVLVTADPHDGPVHATFTPAAVTVGVEPPTGSARNQWSGRVVSAVPHGDLVRLHLDTAGGLIADVTAPSAARLGLVPGTLVWASVKATEVGVVATAAPAAPPLH